MIRPALALCATLTTTTVSPTPTLAADLDHIRRAGALAVIAEVRQGDRIQRAATGRTKLGSPATPTGREHFRAGSIVKSFVATVILQLVGEGRLALDDTVATVLELGEDRVELASRVTVRHLLTHSSGVPEYLPDGEIPGGTLASRFRTWDPRELVALSRRHERPFEPGAAQAYSNTNYVLLGMMIERVTGRDFGEEIRRRIVVPLGLKDTEVPGARTTIRGPHLHGYLDGSVDVSRFNLTVAAASGNLNSTTADLNRFYRALLTGRLLPPALLRLMTTGQEYGMGLGLKQTPCGLVVGHTGTAFGYQTMSFHLADGSRQASISYTPRTGRELAATNEVLWRRLCPSVKP
ncbi:serine hydrolase domain-containing protein [Nonomuraea sp. NPDC050310]|uniref:serine hydrolase domain-containing protein n=1 Tax=Nonomuraea sp. NPDC050310 TaxID=3154935 RepID=UPI0033CA5950